MKLNFHLTSGSIGLTGFSASHPNMRVAFLVSTFPKLSETFILNQITGLLDAGHEVTIFAQRRPATELQHSVVDEYALLDRTIYADAPSSYLEVLSLLSKIVRNHPDVIPHVIESLRRGKAGGERIANLRLMLDHSSLSTYDVIHGHFGTTCLSFDFLLSDDRFGVESDIPFVASFYGYDVSEVLVQDPNAYATLFPHCDAVTALSDDMMKKLADAGCSTDKIVKQQLAIDTEQYRFRPRHPPDDGSIKVFTIARFAEKKGLKYAVDAIAQLKTEYDVSYRIAGEGPLREQIEKRINQRSIDDIVDILGWVDQATIKQELANAQVFLLPSVTANDGDQEGTPTVLLEAQATGLPVVSTHHAGIPEIVADGESGILVPERDVDALVNGLQTLFDSPDRWHQMGQQGRKLVEKSHSISAMTRRLERLYSRVSESNE